MNISFTASEDLELEVEEKEVTIKHYLRKPQRLVKTIANPDLMTELSQERFLLRMNPLHFLDMYHFQPKVVLKVWSTSEGVVNLQSESCEIKGIDYINDRFSLNLKGQLSPQEIQGRTYLRGKAELEVKVELPPPLWLTPRQVLEPAGNGLLKSVLVRIKNSVKRQLVKDYLQWADDYTASDSNSSSSTLSIAENPTT